MTALIIIISIIIDYNNYNNEYMDSKEPFNAIKNNQIKFSEVKNKQNEFLSKLNEAKNW